MARAKKAKRNTDVVTYFRMKSEVRERIAEIAAKRGWPHTIASVTAEMIEQGLAAEAKAA
jgi:predicted DNA-binding protein